MAAGLVWLALTMLAPTTRLPRCLVTAPNGTEYSLELDQANNAALISAVTLSRGLDHRTVTIALATALQESKLRNLDYGDRDSVGLFQQRPSMGWGTIEEIMNPVYSTNIFLDRLVEIEGYLDLPLTEAAQQVQISAFPDAYAKHENRSRVFAEALAGLGELTCYFSSQAGDTDLSERIQTDWQGAVEITTSGSGATLTSATIAPAALANYAVATASSTGVRTVIIGDQEWRPAWGEWRTSRSPAPDGVVQVTF